VNRKWIYIEVSLRISAQYTDIHKKKCTVQGC